MTSSSRAGWIIFSGKRVTAPDLIAGFNKEEKLTFTLQPSEQWGLGLAGGIGNGRPQVGPQFGARDHVVLIEVGISFNGL